MPIFFFDTNNFQGNESDSYGGGVYLYDSGYNADEVTVTNSNFCGNKDTFGGGFYTNDLNIASTWQYNIFQANIVSPSGGGLYLANGNYPDVINSTFVGNAASSSGGGVYAGSSTNPEVQRLVRQRDFGRFRLIEQHRHLRRRQHH